MFKLKSILAALGLVFCLAAPAMAQNADEMRGALEAHLPDWWSVTAFEVESARVAPTATSTETVMKPGATPPATSGRRAFTATIESTEQLYDPAYSLGGAAFVEAVMPAGEVLHISGAIFPNAEEGERVTLDQEGIERLGYPIDGFDTQAFIIGSEEAEQFMAEHEAARAEGDMRKLMNDEGTDL